MAISASFSADFSSFYSALTRAEVQLKSFEAGAGSVEKSLTRMGNSFTGVKIIQDAHLMTAAMLEVGGMSKLTDHEMARLGATVAEASDKMRRMGLEVPPGFQRITEEAGKIEPKMRGVHQTFAAFDGVLASMGVHIGPEVRGLEDLANASEKTATQLGAIATVGLAVGAAMGGWKIGRAIADFLGLDDAIGRATSSLLGFGSVAEQVAGANADKLAEASRRVGHAITDLEVATIILNSGLRDTRTNLQISAEMVAIWHHEIASVKELGSLTADLNSQNFAIKDLAARYGLSVEALQLFQREQAKAADAVEDADKKIVESNKKRMQQLKEDLQQSKQDAAELERVYEDMSKVTEDVLVKSLKDEEKAREDATQAAKDYEKAGVDAAERIAEAQRKTNDELKRAKELTDAAAAANRMMGGSTTYDLGTEEGRRKVPADIAALLHDGYNFEQAARLAYAMKMGFSVDRDPLFAAKGPRVPGFAGGVQNFMGGMALVGERGPELVRLPRGSDVIPNGQMGGVSIVLNVSGGVWVNNKSELVQIVKDGIMQSLRAQGMRMPSGA